MAINEKEMKKLAEQVAEYVEEQRARRPKLKLVVPESARDPNAIPDELRLRHERRIYFLTSQCRAPWLIDQALGEVSCIEELKDDELLRLLGDCELALRCIMDGVSFIDVGLVRAYAD